MNPSLAHGGLAGLLLITALVLAASALLAYRRSRRMRLLLVVGAFGILAGQAAWATWESLQGTSTTASAVLTGADAVMALLLYGALVR